MLLCLSQPLSDRTFGYLIRLSRNLLTSMQNLLRKPCPQWRTVPMLRSRRDRPKIHSAAFPWPHGEHADSLHHVGASQGVRGFAVQQARGNRESVKPCIARSVRIQRWPSNRERPQRVASSHAIRPRQANAARADRTTNGTRNASAGPQ